ncbi:acetylornithine transaminase [Intrasporangium calvum]|uniref:Acetylornithine aminotransferase n=1 Tax=Intrasporangium calvum (strain ATCC 23552 / DSM 43043 / JCM 3097 / NBRC 12989 / NCIMB 10167 / NRRL B-3866 / 7 KIP) TaxID=710696 RepID=E6S8E9_INTC7|nr:acetylornithine transaminase [Intrasporangium calvum]ADU48070.1 acetylornithine aminotransferase apoenzyme [Intrasporangium calvum DSM 43043]
MTVGSDLLHRYSGAMVQVFGPPQLVLASGHGCWVTDVDGKRYLDLLSGIAVNALGHGHPALVQAVAKQAEQAIHISNFFTSEPAILLAERLLTLANAPAGSGVFFANSGAEAIEAAIKLSRRTGRKRIVALEGSFHGRTTGALALTHKPAYREPFEPLIPEVTFVPPGDEEALREAVDEATAALVIEPIQGEAGVRELTAEYLRLARELTSRHGALLVLDEIQTGIGRTGHWFAHQAAGIIPDAMTLAKGLGGGVPIGALVTFGGEVSTLLGAGQHGTTFGGNPLACAAGLAVLDTIEREDLLGNARTVGAMLDSLTLDGVSATRGRGLLRAIELSGIPAPAAMAAAREAGFIVNAVTPTALRLTPPLILTEAELQGFIDALPAILETARSAS